LCDRFCCEGSPAESLVAWTCAVVRVTVMDTTKNKNQEYFFRASLRNTLETDLSRRG